MILIDDFLDKESIEQLNDWDLWLSLNRKYSWYDKSEPTNLWESFIEYAANRLDIFDKYVGFEYWGNAVEVKTLQQGNNLRWHIDKDETTVTLYSAGRTLTRFSVLTNTAKSPSVSPISMSAT